MCAAQRPNGRAPTRRPSGSHSDASTDLVRAAPRRLSRLWRTSSAVDEPNPAPVRGERRSSCPSSPTTSPTAPHPRPRTPTAPPPRTEEAHPLQAGAPVRPESPTFAELGVRPEIVAALAEAGIERTFAIQELTLPLALAGEDIIGQARTGIGKTLGFGVPLLQRVIPPAEQPAADVRRRSRRPHQGRPAGPGRGPHPRAVRPGRQGPGRRRRPRSASGSPRSTAAGPTSRSSRPCARASTWWSARPAACSTSPSSATSCSAASRRWCWTRPTRCSTSGFLPDVERIMRMLPEQRQTMLFSATMPGPIIALSRAFLNRPTHIRAEEADQGSIHERTRAARLPRARDGQGRAAHPRAAGRRTAASP